MKILVCIVLALFIYRSYEVACTAGTYIPTGGSATDCPIGSFSTSIADPCPATCTKCGDGKSTSAIKQATDTCALCSTLDAAKTFAYVGTSAFEQLCEAACPSGTFVPNDAAGDALKQCVKCTASANCKECAGNIADGPTTCTKCAAANSGTKYYLDSSKCVAAADCPAGTWAKVSATPAATTEGTCEKCTTGCKVCGVASDFITEECTECVADLGYIIDTTKKQCVNCVANCKTCSDATTCTACKDTTFKLSSDGKKCEASSSSSGNKLAIGFTMTAIAGFILA